MLNKKILIPAAAAAAAVLIIFTIYNTVKLNRLAASAEANKNLILNESADGRETNDYLNNISSMLAHDLNRTRVSLGLIATDYPFKSITGETETDSGIEGNSNELFDAVEVLLEAEKTNQKSAMLGRFFRNEIISSVITDTGSNVEKINNTLFSIRYMNEEYITADAAGENEIRLRSFTGKELNINSASKEVSLFISSCFEDLMVVSALRKEYQSNLQLLTDREIAPETFIKAEFKNNGIVVTNIYNPLLITAGVEVEDGNVSYRISSVDKKYQDFTEFKRDLAAEIKSMDLRTDEETLLDKAKADLETKLADAEFNIYLESLGLSVSDVPREDLDYFYYDIIKEDGNRLGSFSILKKIGEIYLVDADEVPVSSLKTLAVKKKLDNSSENKLVIPENIPEIDSLYSNKDTVTFLLVGNHERNTDTMILVHADKPSGKAYMIGIPRDLYWKGRKINSIYQYYGAEQFKRELSDITGLDISNYIIVDMYAFIDIVNILGGIEVTLDEDLIDPTYRIRENGEWSTLNYSSGTYNMNGVEALRVARSRHGSNDFDRSERQQMIIESLLNRILELKLTDIYKVYSMMQAMFEYIDTDFSLVEMMSIFNNYSDVKLAGKHVLSFDNILYDTYSNIYMLEEQEVEFEPDFNKGAWILFPRDNNWNNIRWYIRQIINGEL